MLENFSKRLRKIRKSKGLTQKQLAEKVGIDSQTICRYEKGYHYPSLMVLEWICQGLEVSSKDLLGF